MVLAGCQSIAEEDRCEEWDGRTSGRAAHSHGLRALHSDHPGILQISLAFLPINHVYIC